MRQHEQNQHRPAAGLLPEHFDLRAKIGVGAGAQQFLDQRALPPDCLGDLREVHGFCRGLCGLPGRLKAVEAEAVRQRGAHVDLRHEHQVLEQFQQAALLGRQTVIECGRIDLRNQVEQNAYFVLKRVDEFVFSQDHEADVTMKSVKRRKLKMTGYPEVETDGRGGATMIWPGETEAGSAGTQPR
jgi:hypothetical protein